jgi:hypothetical protein
MKTSELTGAALDWAVAKCEKYPMDVWYDEEELPMIRDDEISEWKPSTDWAQGGPIIERDGISLTSYLDEKDPYWIGSVECQYRDFNATAYYEECGPTPLIAAMRCYVASMLGDEVDVPEELQ